jgi:hypothetical protein
LIHSGIISILWFWAAKIGFQRQDYALRVAGYAVDDPIIETRNSHPETRNSWQIVTKYQWTKDLKPET